MTDQLSLRHALATLGYRAAKAVREVPEGFSQYRPADGSRSAGEILAHICDLMDWGLTQARGVEVWHNTETGDWQQDSERFFATLTAYDQYLASGEPIAASPETLFQGSIADALTHTGQIAMLRRLAGARVTAEDYSKANIAAGLTTARQPKPVREFGE